MTGASPRLDGFGPTTRDVRRAVEAVGAEAEASKLRRPDAMAAPALPTQACFGWMMPVGRREAEGSPAVAAETGASLRLLAARLRGRHRPQMHPSRL